MTAWRVEGQYLVWLAEVETPFGLAAGHAAANLGDNAKRVDAKNPFENGETSAIGHALRHLGYGFGFEAGAPGKWSCDREARERAHRDSERATFEPGRRAVLWCSGTAGSIS